MVLDSPRIYKYIYYLVFAMISTWNVLDTNFILYFQKCLQLLFKAQIFFSVFINPLPDRTARVSLCQTRIHLLGTFKWVILLKLLNYFICEYNLWIMLSPISYMEKNFSYIPHCFPTLIWHVSS